MLYGSDASGISRPFAVAHAARWVEPGTGHLSLDFGHLASDADLHAPYERRDLQLNHQSRSSPLETRARALRIER